MDISSARTSRSLRPLYPGGTKPQDKPKTPHHQVDDLPLTRKYLGENTKILLREYDLYSLFIMQALIFQSKDHRFQPESYKKFTNSGVHWSSTRSTTTDHRFEPRCPAAQPSKVPRLSFIARWWGRKVIRSFQSAFSQSRIHQIYFPSYIKR